MLQLIYPGHSAKSPAMLGCKKSQSPKVRKIVFPTGNQGKKNYFSSPSKTKGQTCAVHDFVDPSTKSVSVGG